MTNETLLLVEDDPQAVILLNRTFKKRGFNVAVTVASDGAQALETLIGSMTAGPSCPRLPAIVLLDLDLPKVHGFEVLKRIRAHPRTKTLPVIILTSDRDMDAALGYTFGANGFLRKPLDFAAFSQALLGIGLGALVKTGGRN